MVMLLDCREKMLAFIVKLKVPASDPVLGGGFQMHPGGEVDIRGTYTALAVLTHTHTPTPYIHTPVPR